MKQIAIQILRAVWSPLAWCYETVHDAPILCCSNDLIGFENSRSTVPSESASCHSGTSASGGWVCRAD